MELVDTDEYDGYYLTDIQQELGSARFADFQAWLYGQTLALHEGRAVVYRWDYERFLDGRPIID